MTVWRFDRGELGKAHKTAFGFLHVPATVTRVGVFTYAMPDGKVRRELRPPEEVLSKENLASIASSVITNEHPKDGIPVTPENVKEFGVGHADSAPEVRGEFVDLGLTLTDADAMRDVMSRRKTEVSCGYRCRIDHAPGVWRGMDGKGPPEPYDVIQRGHVNNHICITQKARGGSDIRMHLDSEDAVQVDSEQPKRGSMKFRLDIDGQIVEFEPEVAGVLKPYLNKRDSALKAETERADGLKTDLDKLQAKCDQAEADLKAAKESRSDSIDPKRLSIAVQARTTLMQGAAVLLTAEEVGKLDSATDAEVRTLAVRKHTDLKLDSDAKSADYRSDDYVTARFDSLVDAQKGVNNQKLATGAVLAGQSGGAPDTDPDFQKRIDASIAKTDSAWRGASAAQGAN